MLVPFARWPLRLRTRCRPATPLPAGRGEVSRHHLIFVIESARGAAGETASVVTCFGRSPEGAPLVLGSGSPHARGHPAAHRSGWACGLWAGPDPFSLVHLTHREAESVSLGGNRATAVAGLAWRATPTCMQAPRPGRTGAPSGSGHHPLQASARTVNQADQRDSMMTSHVHGGKAWVRREGSHGRRPPGAETTSRRWTNDYFRPPGCHHRHRQRPATCGWEPR